MTNHTSLNGVLATMRSGAVAAVAVLAVAGCGAQSPVPRAAPQTTASVRVQPAAVPRRSTVIPWIGAPAPTYTPAKPLPSKPLSRHAPACSADQVRHVLVPASPKTQETALEVAFTNISTKDCLLLGFPRVTTWGNGYGPVVVKNRESLGTSFDMPPGGRTWLGLGISHACLGQPRNWHGPVVTRLRVAMPGGGSVTVSGLSVPVTCGGFYELNFYRQSPEVRYPLVALSGAKFFLETPTGPARAGLPYTYVLVVRNPTTKPITLRPCPAYDEWLSTGTSTGSALLLNCQGRKALAAGATLRYAMLLTIPTDAPTGTAVLHWSLRDGQYPDMGRRTISIIGNDNPCRAGQLTASAPEAAVPFAGTGIYGPKDSGTSLSVTVTNTSSTWCTLQGAPTVAVIGHDGTTVPLHWGEVGFGIRPPPPPQIRLAPGTSARTVLSWHAKWCGGDPNPVTVDLGLPSGGGAVRVRPAHGWTPPACKGWDFPYQVSSTELG
jgi:hypothetical protein